MLHHFPQRRKMKGKKRERSVVYVSDATPIDFSTVLSSVVPVEVTLNKTSNGPSQRKKQRKDEKRLQKHPMLPPCECKMMKCTPKISCVRRQEIYDAYWALSNTDQKEWIFNHIEQFDPKRRYTSSTATSHKQQSRKYWLPNEAPQSDKLYICKRMFMNTIGLTSDKTITSSLKSTSDLGVTRPDGRGKHSPKHKITEEQRQFMINHIHSFQPQISRSEHTPKHLYLPSELTIKEMVADYFAECHITGQSCLKYVSYTRQLRKMKISFAKLGTEECELCDKHKIHMSSLGQDSHQENSDENNDNEEKVKKNGKMQLQKITQKEEEEVCNDENCEECKIWKEHKEKYVTSRSTYKADEDKVFNKQNVSSD